MSPKAIKVNRVIAAVNVLKDLMFTTILVSYSSSFYLALSLSIELLGESIFGLS